MNLDPFSRQRVVTGDDCVIICFVNEERQPGKGQAEQIVKEKKGKNCHKWQILMI